MKGSVAEQLGLLSVQNYGKAVIYQVQPCGYSNSQRCRILRILYIADIRKGMYGKITDVYKRQ